MRRTAIIGLDGMPFGLIRKLSNPQTAQRYQIVGVPTFALFRAEQLVQRRTGSQSMQQLLRLLDEAL